MMEASASPWIRVMAACASPSARAAAARPSASIANFDFCAAARFFDALPLDLRLLQNRGDQFFLVPQDLGFLHLHLALFFDLLYLDLLGDHALLHDIGLELVGLVGLGFLPAGRLGKLRLLDVEVALGFGLPSERSGLGDHAILVARSLGDGRFAERVRAADGGIAFRFGRGDLGVAFDAGDVRPTHVGDVFVLVAHLADGEGDDLETHLAHVVGAGGAHALGHHLRLFHNLLNRQLADDAAQVTFHDQADETLALVGRLGEELLGGGKDRLLVGADLDLRDGLDRNGDALLGVEVLLRCDVEAHQFEGQFPGVFNNRKDNGTVALDDARAAKTVDDQSFVGTSFAEHAGKGGQDEQGDENRKPDDDEIRVVHGSSFCL